MHEVINPPSWPRPKGYSNGIKARGTMVFTAGVVGWNAEEQFESDKLADQLRHALLNTKTILTEAGAEPAHIVRMTWYVTDKNEYVNSLKAVGEIWRDILGRVFPCMACVEVSALVEDAAKIEIETTAIIPD